MRVDDGPLNHLRQRLLDDAGAQRLRDGRYRGEIGSVDRFDLRAHRRGLFQRFQEQLEGMRRHHESGRHVDPGGGQLAQARALAAHGRAIGDPEVSEPADRILASQ